jgi:hypothetical protein
MRILHGWERTSNKYQVITNTSAETRGGAKDRMITRTDDGALLHPKYTTTPSQLLTRHFELGFITAKLLSATKRVLTRIRVRAQYHTLENSTRFNG